ncbi:MAG: substrate-binding domain-containing protein, partial [Kiritimatiellae bacterium]|nr:substrate-binding domain-containing protein [Kiritimatiellia bacterium]
MTKGIHPPAILAVLPLAYQDGRDCYAGILQYLAARGIRWDIHLVREAISRAVFTRELARGVDGILFNGHQLDARLAPLVPPHIPCVGLDAAHPEAFAGRAKVAFVDIDSDAIGRRGAEYLAAQGNYAAFGIVGYEGYDWSESRVASFGTALSGMGYACDALRVKRANLHDGSVHEKMREWAARLHRPAAVMAACDELGRAFIDALVAGGVRVPQDVAVLGVDNEWILCTHLSPTLSSIQPDFVRSGFLAAECMDRLLRRGAGVLRRISPVKGIIGRESTAP